MYTIIPLIVLILDIIAIVKVVQSGVDTGTKVLWIVIILLLPLLGMLLYFLIGPKG